MSSKPFAPSLLLLAMVSVASGQITPSGGGYLFRAQYRKGQVLRYQTQNVLSGKSAGASPAKLALPITMKVEGVQGPFALVRVTIGSPTSAIPMRSALLRLNNRNQAVDGASAGVASVLPPRAVKIGDTWSGVAPVTSEAGATRDLRAEYKFVGLGRIEGQSVAKLSFRLSGAAKGGGTVNLLRKDGSVWTMQSKTSLADVAGYSLSTKLRRLP